jgi:hypothetical protein
LSGTVLRWLAAGRRAGVPGRGRDILDRWRKIVSGKKDTVYSGLIDRDFVFELAKRGKVSLCSNQISIEVGANDGDLDGLVIPPHTHLQYMHPTIGRYDGHETATLTFVCERRSGSST